MLITAPATQLKGSSGLRDTATATIKANAHAFRMLSSGLYSNKIAAVLREIGCNAADAHIEAGTPDLPIEVKLPTKLNEQFYIRDWGPGLSHEQMVGSPNRPGLYLNYFDSTKQDSNTQTGAFGLGCKSPFSYTDSFVVTSAHAGVKRIYSVYVGEAGVPTISLMGQSVCDADWPHGVMVGFPVAPGDIWQFAKDAQTVFQWFKIPPRILGGAPITPVKYSFETPEFAISASDCPFTVVMGNVHYQVNKADIGADDYSSDIISRILYNTELVIKANIGDVQVTPSRETLQFDAITKTFIQEAVKKAGKVLCDEFIKKTKTVLSRGWEGACSLKGDVAALFSNTYHLDDILKHYGHQPIGDDLYRSGIVQINGTSFKNAQGQVSRLIPKSRRDPSLKVSTTLFARDTTYNRDIVGRIELLQKTIIVHGQPLRFRDRIRKAILDQVYDQIIYMPDPADAKRLSTAIYDCPMIDCSTLPVPAPKPRQKKGTKPPLPTLQVTVHGVDGLDAVYDVNSVPADMKYYLIDASYTTWGNQHTQYQVLGNDNASDYHWGVCWRSFRNYHTNAPIAGYALVKKRITKRLDANGWKELTISIQEWLKSKATVDEITAIAKEWSPTIDVKRISEEYSDPITVFCALKEQGLLTKEMKDLLPFLSVIEEVHKASNSASNKKIPELVNKYNDVCRHFNVPVLSMPAKTIEQQNKAITDKYPAMGFLSIGQWKKVQPAQIKPLLAALLEVK